MVQRIFSQMGFDANGVIVEPFCNEEDGSFYDVWKVTQGDKPWILKKAKGGEAENYRCYLHQGNSFAPKLYASMNVDGDKWLLLEYIPGNNLMHCDREHLTSTLDSLIAMQNQFWQTDDLTDSFNNALKNRENRQSYLHNPRLECVYRAYLEDFKAIPRTLCHDDLLPFNVIVNKERAVFIDWEVGGILPWSTSIARLIAHGKEDANAFFYMTEADKTFAVDYFYEHFLKGRVAAYDTYRRSVDLAIFYEYCEWIYVGNKYGDTESDRFREYTELALNQAEMLGF